MLEIRPIEDKEEQKNICEKCGMEFNEALFAYKAYDAGELLACCQFDILGADSVIYGMEQVTGTADDYESMFIMGRAVMNFLDLCSVQRAEFRVTDAHSEKMAKLLGFRNIDGKYVITLTGLFNEPCKHGNSYQDTKNK